MLGLSSLYPPQWRAWMSLCLEAHSQFERGDMTEQQYRSWLIMLGFRRNEIEAEIELHRRTA